MLISCVFLYTNPFFKIVLVYVHLILFNFLVSFELSLYEFSFTFSLLNFPYTENDCHLVKYPAFKSHSYILQVLSYSSAELWWSARLVAQGMISESPDGIHLAPRALHHTTQILLNMYCNDNMNFNDGTCCSSAESYTTLQIVTFAFFGVW